MRKIPDLKRCRCCGAEKPGSAFRRNRKLRDGLSSWCVECHNAAARASRRVHGQKYNAGKRQSLKNRPALVAITPQSDDGIYLQVVSQDPCSYCGAPATELDHIERRDGTNDAWENLTAACRSCNARKQSMSLLGWMIRRRLLDDGFDDMRAQWRLAA